MFGLLKKADKGHWFHPGAYKFKLPFINPFYLVKEDSGEVPIYHCNIEIIVGENNSFKQGIMATVIIEAINNPKYNIGVTNHIEHIATMVKKSYLDVIFHTGAYGDHKLEHDEIRWIETHEKGFQRFYDLPDQEVTFTWSKEKDRYINPEWKVIKE